MNREKSAFVRRPKASVVSGKKPVRPRKSRNELKREDGANKSGSQLATRQVTLSSKDKGVVSSGLAKRREELKQVKRRQRRRKIVIGVLVALLVGTSGYLLGFSPVFAYDSAKTRVMGANSQVTTQQVKEELANYAGRPLLRFPTSEAASSLQRANPWVKQAKVKREFPRGIAVYLTLRTPVAKTAQGKVVDLEGKLLPDQGFDTSKLLEVASSCPQSDIEDCLKSVAQVVQFLPAEIKQKIKSAQVARLDNVELQLQSGAKVIWGKNGDNQKKAQVLTVLLQRAGSIYNVTDYAHPTISN